MAVSIPLPGLAETGGGQEYPYCDTGSMDIIGLGSCGTRAES
jgi:hypothetical protein